MNTREEITVPETIQEQYDRVTFGDNKVYFPTEREQLLLDALLNPDYADLSVKKKISEVAGVSYSTYHRAFKKPGFIAIYHKLLMNSMQSDVPKVINAMRDFAISNPSNNSDRVAFLKIAGLIEDKRTIDINKKSVNVDVNIESAPTEELKEILRQMIREDPKLIEGIEIDEE